MPKRDSRAPQIGAVAYLNMLPYFYGDEDVILYRTPHALNEALASGTVDAGCSSVIAGLELGLEPLRPLAGVAAEAGVGSVFVEPVMAGPLDAEHWHSVRSALLRSTDPDSGFQSGLSLSVERLADISEVVILTTGASAQSLWLVQVLLRAIGLIPRVIDVDPRILDLSPEALAHECASASGQGQLCCLLAIGDPALRRLYRFPLGNQGQMRLDIGTLWKAYMGLPCLFALWFVQPGLPKRVLVGLSARLQACLSRWHALPKAARLSAARAFLARSWDSCQVNDVHERRQVASLDSLMGPSGLAHYLECLCFDLAEPAFAASFERMVGIYRCEDTVRGGERSSTAVGADGTIEEAVLPSRGEFGDKRVDVNS